MKILLIRLTLAVPSLSFQISVICSRLLCEAVGVNVVCSSELYLKKQQSKGAAGIVHADLCFSVWTRIWTQKDDFGKI